MSSRRDEEHGIPIAQAVRPSRESRAKSLWESCVVQVISGIIIIGALITMIIMLSRRYRIEQFQQLVVTDVNGMKTTVEEEGLHRIGLWEDGEIRTAETLKATEFAITEDERANTMSVVHGPGKLWLGPYEKLSHKGTARALSVNEYMEVTNEKTKERKIVRGDAVALYMPAASGRSSDNPKFTDEEENDAAYEEFGTVKHATRLSPQQYVVVTNNLDGSRKVVRGTDGAAGNGLLYMPCDPANAPQGGYRPDNDPCAYEEIGSVQNAVTLSATQYVRVENELDGSVKIVRGQGSGIQYMPCIPTTDSATGLPIPVAPADPCAYESIGSVQDARIVTAESALLVRETDTGIVKLIDAPGPFFPGPYDEIDPEPRELIRVAEYETVVLAMEDGSFEFRSGAQNGTFQDPLVAEDSPTTAGVTTTSGTSFFLPPYSNLLTFEWTVGYDVEDQGGTTESSRAGEMRTFNRLDQRMQQLFFQYDDVRTNDNIEFEVEGTIFWQIEDVPKLVTATNDPTGDIWHRMRSQIAQAAGDYNYAGFLTSLRNMTTAVRERELDSPFYSMRGIKVYDFQLIEVELKDEELEANIVDAMALEAIDRINRVNQEISESEVEIVRLEGVYNVDAARAQNEKRLEELRAETALAVEQNHHDLKVAQQRNKISLEEERSEYLQVVHTNSMIEATTIGAMEGTTQGASINEYLVSLNTSDLHLSDAVRLYELRLAYQNANATSSNIAMGAAELYLTSDDANLHLGDALHVNVPSEAPDSSSG